MQCILHKRTSNSEYWQVRVGSARHGWYGRMLDWQMIAEVLTDPLQAMHELRSLGVEYRLVDEPCGSQDVWRNVLTLDKQDEAARIATWFWKKATGAQLTESEQAIWLRRSILDDNGHSVTNPYENGAW